MELLRLLDQFFERAICYGAEGYESARIGNVDCLHVAQGTAAAVKRL
jgi:hypothetical protein